MARKQCLKHWPALFTLICWKSLVSLLLIATALEVWGYDRTPAVYFYVYWVSAGVTGLLQIWVITELACAVAPAIGTILRKVIPALATLFLAGSAFLVDGAPASFPLYATRLVVNMDRAVSLGWLVTFIVLFYASRDVLGIRWNQRTLGVAFGLSLQAIGKTGVSWLLDVFPGHWYVLSNIQGGIWIVALGSWISVFLRAEQGCSELYPLDSLKAVLATYTQTLQKLRRQ